MADELDIVATIHNRHIKSGGPAPKIDSRECPYASTFQNELGEQWAFWVDKDSKTFLAGGDIGWNYVKEVTSFDLRMVERSGHSFPCYFFGPDEEDMLLLGTKEGMFFAASWGASRPVVKFMARRKKEATDG